jgi:23S rRNA U2552 (ribose-2'-O)-methylase RlmE/FtsJ
VIRDLRFAAQPDDVRVVVSDGNESVKGGRLADLVTQSARCRLEHATHRIGIKTQQVGICGRVHSDDVFDLMVHLQFQGRHFRVEADRSLAGKG